MLPLKLLMIFWLFLLVLHRAAFRKLIFRTNDWRISLRPVNGKEIKGLIGNLYPYDARYIRSRNIYRFHILFLIMLLLTTQLAGRTTKNNTMEKLEIGDYITPFTLENQHGKVVDIASFLGKKNLVIFFYPKDDTPGCTKEVCTFRDQYDDFVDAQAEVMGISSQSVESHYNFAQKHGIRYNLLSDPGNKVRKQFGVPGIFFGLLPGRVTYVIDKKGRIVHVFNSQTNISGHVEEAKKILEQIR